jgi:hypothetical protein
MRGMEPGARAGQQTMLDDVMAIRRITISVPENVAVRIKRAAGRQPVSSWVTAVIDEKLDDAELERQWEAFYRDVAPKRDDIRRADASARGLTRRRRRGAARR